jgi:stage II sporulation protein AA (anti-sigma F factor antagonist)
MTAQNDINISFSRPERNPDVSVISVGGFIDTTTSSELEESLKRLLKQGQFNIVVDLGSVNYISSAGWGIFISEIKEIRENGGDLKLAAMIGDVYEVFELLEFQTILEAFDSIQEAVDSFASSSPEKNKTKIEVETDEEKADDGAKVRSSHDGS